MKHLNFFFKNDVINCDVINCVISGKLISRSSQRTFIIAKLSKPWWFTVGFHGLQHTVSLPQKIPDLSPMWCPRCSKFEFTIENWAGLWMDHVLKQVWGQIEHQSVLLSLYLIHHLNNKWSKRNNLGHFITIFRNSKILKSKIWLFQDLARLCEDRLC